MRARALVALAALVLLTSVSCRERTCAKDDLDLGIWYWHTPYRLSEKEAKQLREMEISRVYVRTATFDFDAGSLMATLPQSFGEGTERLPIVLVFNASPDLARRLERIEFVAAARAMAKEIAKSQQTAEAKGAEVVGVQLDFDVPTRLVPIYANLLREIRKQLPIGTELSSTALTTWLGSDRVGELCHAVDFLVPQFYEGRTPGSVNDMKPISDPAELMRGLEQMERLPGEFRIGLPTYGHALLFDPKGKLRGTYRGLSVDDAMRHPSLAPEAFYGMDASGGPAKSKAQYIGEDLVRLRAREPGRNGRGLGYSIAYLLPTPEILARPMRSLRRAHPTGLKGAILYRFPEPGESMCLPLASLSSALKGEKASVSLQAKLTGVGQDLGASDFRIELSNRGDAPTFPGEVQVFALAIFDRPGLNEVHPGDFASAASGIWNEEMGELIPSGPMRANAVLFKAPRLAAGQTLRSGLISFREGVGLGGATIRWMARGQGGFETIEGEEKAAILATKGAMQ